MSEPGYDFFKAKFGDIVIRESGGEPCEACNGSGRIWYMNGGPHGIGNHGKCPDCDGSGIVNAALNIEEDS